jgi:hypothetical protein
MKRGDFTIQGRVTVTYLRQEAVVQPGGHAIFPWVLVLVVAPDDGGKAQDVILQSGALLQRPEEPSGQRNGHRVIVHARMEKLHPFTRVRMPEAAAFHDLGTWEKWAVRGMIRDAQPGR